MVSSRKAKPEELTVNCEFEGCERKFVTKNGMRTHLSAVHKIRGNNYSNKTDEEKASTICQNCNIDFGTVKSRVAHGSPEKCAKRLENNNWKTFICKNIDCGKEFTRYISPKTQKNKNKGQYCSHECSIKSRIIHEILFKICANTDCGKVFSTKIEKQIYCSSKCGKKHSGYKVKDSSRMGGPREGGGHSKLLSYTNIFGEAMSLNREEIILAEYLDKTGFKWTRNLSKGFEYVDLKGNKKKFYPDFYIPSLELYVEYKGWVTKEMKHKMSEAVINDSSLNLCIVSGRMDKCMNLGILIDDLLSGKDSLRITRI